MKQWLTQHQPLFHSRFQDGLAPYAKTIKKPEHIVSDIVMNEIVSLCCGKNTFPEPRACCRVHSLWIESSFSFTWPALRVAGIGGWLSSSSGIWSPEPLPTRRGPRPSVWWRRAVVGGPFITVKTTGRPGDLSFKSMDPASDFAPLTTTCSSAWMPS